tara:strand:- start:2136 stop:7535 length:5400 start_codon:yes stop_codon:yes gene_type:complete
MHIKKMKNIACILFFLFHVVLSSKNGLQEYWKYNFENSISSTGVIDVDYSQANEVVMCKTSTVEYYTHNGTSYTLSESIAIPCTSVAVSKGPHLNFATADTQLMIGDSNAKKVSFYKKTNSGFQLSTAFTETEDNAGVEVAMPTAGKYAASVGQKNVYVYMFNNNVWSKLHSKEMTSTNKELHVDLNHDDIMIVSVKNVLVEWFRVRFSDLTSIQVQKTANVNVGASVATTVSCKGSQVAYSQDNALQIYLQDPILGLWSKTQTIRGQIIDVEMSLCMIALRYVGKVELYMLEQNEDGSFGKKYILRKTYKNNGEPSFGKKIAFKLSDLAILSDTYLSFFRNIDSTKCRKNQYLDDKVCKPCPLGSFTPQLTSETSCTPNTCAVNEYAANGVCNTCGVGTTNVQGGDLTNTTTKCETTLCAVDEHVNNQHQCGSCPAGMSTFGKRYTTDVSNINVCKDIRCQRDQYVESNQCKDCAQGSTAAPGAKASGSDTTCLVGKCGLNEYVKDNKCFPCAPGSTHAANTPLTSSDTTCTVTTCGVNEKVKDNACVSCGDSNAERSAGDPATGPDTYCTCKANFFTDNQGVCQSCPAGTEMRDSVAIPSIPTTCVDIRCGNNQYVENNACHACKSNSHFNGRSKASGSDTYCYCDENYRSQGNRNCFQCPTGYMNPKGDKTDVVSSCKCAENYRSKGDGTCVACPTGSSRKQGDNPIVGDGILEFGNNNHDDYVYKSENDPDILLCQNRQYTIKRITSGHTLRVVKASDCSDCNTGSYSTLPTSTLTGWTDVNGGSQSDYTFADLGVYYYVCTAHSSMVGKITVKDCGTQCSCNPGYRSKGDGTCEICPTGYTTLESSISTVETQCNCAENYRVQVTNGVGSCVPCFDGATRKAGDNPRASKVNTFCSYDGIVYYMDFNTQSNKYSSVINFITKENPTIDMRLGSTYSLVRTSTGSPLRVLTAADCPTCVNGVVPNPVPTSSVSSYDSRAPETGVNESVVVITPTTIGKLYYISTDGTATSVGVINVKFAQCSGVLSEGTYTLTTSCVLKQPVILSGDLTVQPLASASRRFKLRGGNKIILSSDNLHKHFIVKNGHTLSIKDLEITEGYAKDDGGSIEVTQGTVNIVDSILTKNTVASGKKGGVIFAKDEATVTISGSTIKENSAAEGGAIYVDQPKSKKQVGVTIANTVLENNSADKGGSVAMGKESTLTCKDCLFKDNTAKNGGAIYASEKNNLQLDQSTFKSNKASEKYGGAIHSLSCLSNEYKNVTFDANEAEEGGAGVYNSFESGNHSCSNIVSQSEFKNNVVKLVGKKGGGAMYLSAASSTLAEKQLHYITNSNFTNNKEVTTNSDFSWNEATNQKLKVIDQDTAVGMNTGPTIPTTCHKHACIYKPLASSCTAAGAGKVGVKCGCDMGTNTISADTSLKKTQMKTVISILFASDVQATDIIRTVDSNQRYVPPKIANTPADAKALAEQNVILSKPANKEGEAVGEKTVLMKPVIPGKVLCTSFQSWLCEKVTACSSSDGNVTVECDGVQYYPAAAARRRLYKPLHEKEKKYKLGSSTVCLDKPGFPLQQQCTGLDSDGNAQTYDRCKANAVMNAEGICVCNVGFVVSSAGDSCEPISTTCRRDHHVVNGKCQPCAAGTFNLEGDSTALVNTQCDDTYCPPNYHVVNNLCTPCPVGEHTPGYDDVNIQGGTKCCKADEYEFEPTSPNINNNGGSDRICKKCYGNTNTQHDVEARYANLRCCTKGYDFACSRIYDGYNKACFDETSSQCAGFVKYGTLQQGETCTHKNQCDNGVCTNGSCA